MQHESNRRQNRTSRLLKEKGYYIVLSLCLVAVGIAGYVFVSDTVRQNDPADQPVLSVPITAEEPDDPAGKTHAQGALPQDTPVMAETDTEEADAVIRPVSGEVLQDHAMDRLAYNPTTKDWRVHKGIDLAAAPGQAVCAAESGTVTAVYEDDFYGGTVVIRHENGYTTHYANLEPTAAVSAGDEVAAGDVIGTVGETALLELAQDPHLHFEVYLNGSAVDPETFLP